RARNVGLFEIAKRKALLVGLLVLDPEVGDLPQARHDGRNVTAVQDLHGKALLDQLGAAMAQVLAPLALEREILQRNERLLPHLQEHEAEIEIERQVTLADLIEDGLRTIAIGLL